MLIDWFTVGAQVLNFLILVWLLKHFLYRPVLNAIDAREQHIATELGIAAAKQIEAQKERDELQNKNKMFDDQRGTLLAKSAAEGSADRERLMEEARKETDGLRTQCANAIKADRLRLGAQIERLAKEEVFGIARKVLADLSTANLEERMEEVFTRRLGELDVKTKELLAVALRTSSEPALVRSTFALPAQGRAAIQNALNETFSTEVRVRFETEPNVICGIELTANGQKLAWSIAEYLESLEQKVGSLIDAEAMLAPGTPAANAPAPVSIARAASK